MSEKEKKMAADILGIFAGLPENKQHRLLGVAEGMEMANEMRNEAQEKQDCHVTRV